MRTTADRTRILAASLALLALTRPAHAEHVPYGVRATPLPTPQSLLDVTRPLPPPSAAGVAKTNVFYLNYDGAQVSFNGGADNSAQNLSQFQEFAGNYAPYGGGAKRMASFQAVQADWFPYDVVITDKRPGGVYTMCINTPTNPFGGGVLGIAPLDCNDSNGANIVFAFHSDSDQFPPATQATTMSQEIAHAFGLEHVSQPNDIMNPYNAGGDPSFLDQCLNLDGGNIGIQCGQQHQQFCGGNQQNSHQELLWLFGQSAPDTAAPSVQLTAPTSGAVFEAGAGFAIVATATDDVAVDSVDLYINGSFNQSDNTEPYSWDVQNIPAGDYCFKVIASDLANNVAESNEVCISVVDGVEPPPATTDDPSDDTTDPTAGTGEGGDSNSGEDTGLAEADDDAGDDDSDTPTSDSLDSNVGGSLPGLPADYGQDDDSGCRVAPTPLPAHALVLLTLATLTRRRRRTTI